MTLFKSACISLVMALGFTATEASAFNFAEWLKNLQKQAQSQQQTPNPPKTVPAPAAPKQRTTF